MTLVVKPGIISTFQQCQCCTEHASSSHGHLPLFTALQGRSEYTFQGSHHIHDHLAHQPWLLNIAKCIACWRFKTVPGTNAVQCASQGRTEQLFDDANNLATDVRVGGRQHRDKDSRIKTIIIPQQQQQSNTKTRSNVIDSCSIQSCSIKLLLKIPLISGCI